MTRKNTLTFVEFACSCIEELKKSGRYGTAGTYRNALSSLTSYLVSMGRADITLSDVTPSFIAGYDESLFSRRLLRNTVSFYNRTLRAIYNKAVRKCRLRDLHPFDDVYTGIDKTSNRAASERDINGIMSLDTSNDTPLMLTRDLFIFSYLCRGMAFVDMAYLKKSDIEGDYLIYRRKKTGAFLKVKLEDEARRIVRRYSDRTGDSIYVFPILGRTEGWDAYRRYRSALTAYNENLKKIGEKTGCGQPLTSYVSRHSWAGAAYRLGVPMNVIGESLGHSSEKTTRIYVGSISQDRLDEVNHKLAGRIKEIDSSAESIFGQIYTQNSSKPFFL